MKNIITSIIIIPYRFYVFLLLNYLSTNLFKSFRLTFEVKLKKELTLTT